MEWSPLIERHTTIPTQESMCFSVGGNDKFSYLLSSSQTPPKRLGKTDEDSLARQDAPSSVEINILQGEREFAKDNRLIGAILFDHLSLPPNGVLELEITFSLDANGILEVWAHEKVTGRAKRASLSLLSGLSRDQIDNMARNAELYALEVKLLKENAEEQNAAESMCLLAEKTIAELSDRLTLEQKERLLSLVAKIRFTLAENAPDDIKSSRKELEQVFYEISENIYSQFFSDEKHIKI